jgi:hypothetical protein
MERRMRENGKKNKLKREKDKKIEILRPKQFKNSKK